MEISLVNNSGVNRRGNDEVPPPMILVANSVLSMEYKWSVSCRLLVLNGVSQAKSEQIEQIEGDLNLKLVVTVLEGHPIVHACVWIEDLDNVLMNIFHTLNSETDDFRFEISFLGQILLFHRFKYVVRPAEATPTNCIQLSSDPPPKITPYEAFLLHSANIRTGDFRVSVSMRIENVD